MKSPPSACRCMAAWAISKRRARPQHFRDARIAAIYEGTNGIQAIDLVTRKVPLGEGKVIGAFIASLRTALEAVAASERFAALAPAAGEGPSMPWSRPPPTCRSRTSARRMCCPAPRPFLAPVRHRGGAGVGGGEGSACRGSHRSASAGPPAAHGHCPFLRQPAFPAGRRPGGRRHERLCRSRPGDGILIARTGRGGTGAQPLPPRIIVIRRGKRRCHWPTRHSSSPGPHAASGSP